MSLASSSSLLHGSRISSSPLYDDVMARVFDLIEHPQDRYAVFMTSKQCNRLMVAQLWASPAFLSSD